MGNQLDTSLIRVVAVIIAACLGYFLSRYRTFIERREEQRLAAAAFRFELESNLGWLDDIVETRNYLRDEAWIRMKNEGFFTYLIPPFQNRLSMFTINYIV